MLPRLVGIPVSSLGGDSQPLAGLGNTATLSTETTKDASLDLQPLAIPSNPWAASPHTPSAPRTSLGGEEASNDNGLVPRPSCITIPVASLGGEGRLCKWIGK